MSGITINIADVEDIQEMDLTLIQDSVKVALILKGIQATTRLPYAYASLLVNGDAIYGCTHYVPCYGMMLDLLQGEHIPPEGNGDAWDEDDDGP